MDQLARCAEMCAEHAEAVTLLRELADGYRGPLFLSPRSFLAVSWFERRES